MLYSSSTSSPTEAEQQLYHLSRQGAVKHYRWTCGKNRSRMFVSTLRAHRKINILKMNWPQWGQASCLIVCAVGTIVEGTVRFQSCTGMRKHCTSVQKSHYTQTVNKRLTESEKMPPRGENLTIRQRHSSQYNKTCNCQKLDVNWLDFKWRQVFGHGGADDTLSYISTIRAPDVTVSLIPSTTAIHQTFSFHYEVLEKAETSDRRVLWNSINNEKVYE